VKTSELTTKQETFDLQRFFKDLLECSGALNDNPGFALIETLMPSVAADMLQLPSHALLAFDPEVAAETPNSEFITFGSPIIDKALGIGKTVGRVSKKHIGSENTRIPSGMLERAEKKLALSDFRQSTLLQSEIVYCEHILFNFAVRFFSDEKREYMQPILIDAALGKDISYQMSFMNNIFCFQSSKEPGSFSSGEHCGYSFAYDVAKSSLSVAIEKNLELFHRQMTGYILSEAKRLQSYYQGTREEIEKRIAKIDPDDPKSESLRQKITASDMDFKARMGDLYKKYQISLEAELDSATVYIVPKVKNQILVQSHTHKTALVVYYNLAINQVELPFCPGCGKTAEAIKMKKDGALCCPECYRDTTNSK